MKRLGLLAVLLLFAAACASTGETNTPADVQMFQLVGPADLSYPTGEIEIKFGLQIRNRSVEAITLKQVELMPVGSGGPYEVIRRTYYFANQTIEPSASKGISFWAKADAEGDSFANDANAPVSVRAVAIFDSPAGSFRKVLTKNFSQHGVGPTRGD